MDRKERLNEAYNYIRFKGLVHTFTDVAEKMQSTLPNVSSAMNGKEKNLTDNFLKRFVNAFPGLNIDWLLTGEGEMLCSAESLPATAPSTHKDVRMVPLKSLDAIGGYDYNMEQGEEYNERMIPWENAKEGDFAVVVSGTSMMPNIMPGSYVLLRLVEGWREFIEYNILYVLELVDLRRLLKMVHKSDDPECLTLISYNPNNPPQDIRLSFIRKVFKVVGIMTNIGF